MKKGFTLSEVLITLVVIGIVAALTIPSLNNNTREAELKAKAKKTYSMLSQAMAMSSLQGYSPSFKFDDAAGSASDVIAWYNTYLADSLSTIRKCTDGPKDGGWQSLGGCWSNTVVKGLNNKDVPSATKDGIGTGIAQVVLSDGTFLNMNSFQRSDMDKYFGYETKKAGIVVYFDVNGSKGPNKLGKDIYVAVFDKDRVVPAYASKTLDEAEFECTSHYNQTSYGSGFGCLKVLLEDERFFEKKEI